ncbi:hypothetical protein [Parafilimonas sp.]|uniref:hypothetical protein n=1 Tax=Parafilimonas sp. TaxID=1969739 RepID=UPI0039E39CD9
MKKILFSAAVVMSAMGIAVANSNNSAKLPVDNKAYILNDTTPSDTTKPDSSFSLK